MRVVLINVYHLSLMLFLNQLIIYAKASTLVSASIDLCGSEPEIRLTKSGEAAAMTVTLSPVENKGVCKLRVIAPKTHVVSMQFVESITTEIRRALRYNTSEMPSYPPCMMNVYLPDNPRLPVWKGDPCSKDALPDVDLLTPDFKIIWNPPTNSTFTQGRKFLVTAVGKAATCKEPGQHTCMRIGWEPLLCISDQLLCDGNRNCPNSATNSDEDEKLCKKSPYRRPTLEELAFEALKNLEPSAKDAANPEKWLHEKLAKQLEFNIKPMKHEPKKTYGNWRKWQEATVPPSTPPTTPKTEDKPKPMESLSAALSKYGPWGYLVLGTVICGTVLMFCGLWECCFKRPKNPTVAPETQPTTVLIISQDDNRSNPPNYDELDQPPSYSTLFPNDKSEAATNQCGTSHLEVPSAPSHQFSALNANLLYEQQQPQPVQTSDNQYSNDTRLAGT